VAEDVAGPHVDATILVEVVKGAGHIERAKEMARNPFHFWVRPAFPNRPVNPCACFPAHDIVVVALLQIGKVVFAKPPNSSLYNVSSMQQWPFVP
jgi:hypothetical protein